jgi:Lrp/AsnC family transcriptional regulator, regulator for asnA, asnC and gidA
VTVADLQIDDVGRRIVELLQSDGRMSYAAISQQVGLSEAAVRQRVNRMAADGVMQVVAVTDPLQLGFRRQAMVAITVQGALQPVADALAALDEVTYLVIVAGGFDLLCEVLTSDDDELLDLLARIRTVPGVTATQTLTYLRLAKQTYAWGTR